MDRRAFLQAVAGIGIAALLPSAASGELTESVLDEVWEELERAPLEFVVENGRTLVVSDYPDPKTRMDVFNLSESCIDSADSLAWELDCCPPLAWHVGRASEDLREDALCYLEAELEEQELPREEIDRRLAVEKSKWPDTDNAAALAKWVTKIDAEKFAYLAASVSDWLHDEPNWGWEEDYFSDYAHGQSAALAFFRQQPYEVLEALGVEIVEGECPGSTYFAAELRRDIADANRLAEELGVPIRFSDAT